MIHPLEELSGAPHPDQVTTKAGRAALARCVNRLRQVLKTELWPDPHQLVALAFCELAGDRALIADDMGLGKTSTSILRIVLGAHWPAVVVCPAGVLFNWQIEIRGKQSPPKPGWLPGCPVAVVDGQDSEVPPPGWRGVVLTTWSLLSWHVDSLLALQPRMLIGDECFPAGTLITTSAGERPIEDVRIGDMVLSADAFGVAHWRRVLRHIPIRQRRELVRVTHGTGSITCTRDHKLWTYEHGYREAATVAGLTLRTMRDPVHANASRRALLHEGRRWLARTLDRDRNRRPVAQAEAMALPGSSEDRNFERSRVERVEILERGGPPGPRDGCGDDSLVYDLEIDEFHNYFADGVLVSNCHNITNPDADRSETFAYLASEIPHLLLLSGSPIKNVATELWQLLRLINPTAWALEAPFEGLTPEKWANGDDPRLARLKRRVSQDMIRRLKEDVLLTLPPKLHDEIVVVGTPAQMVEYKKAQEQFEKWLWPEVTRKVRREAAKKGWTGADVEKEIEARIDKALGGAALARMMTLRQLAGRMKIDAAVTWLADMVAMGEAPIAFAEFDPVVTAVERGLRERNVAVVVVAGKTAKKKRQEAVEAFQEGRAEVFLGTRAANEGVTLTRSRHTLQIERWWNPAAEDQGADRSHRRGQLRDVTIHVMLAEGTYDVRIGEINTRKREIVRKVVGAAAIRTATPTGDQISEATASSTVGKTSTL